MGSCIICGTSVDGRVCDIHEEDVVFEFRGDQPGELTAGRYYRGTIDGYAEFGIFVDIGDSVTGLLHKSELDRRLDSMELEPGDTVYVQVQNIRDNGNVDLGWSIRQDRSRFRGALIDDPDADEELLAEKDDAEAGTSTPTVQHSPNDRSSTTGDDDAEAAGTAGSATADGAANNRKLSEAEGMTVAELSEYVGKRVRVEGEIETARQTSGPTVFQLRDETGTIECAAFEEAGVRAYPAADEGDVVRIEGEVERRRNELQVETEALVILEAEEREAVAERMREAITERARPDAVEPLAADEAVEGVTEGIRDAATAIRRAVLEGQPVVVRHAATADGYVASTAIERATLPLIREEHGGGDAEYHYFDRRPLEGSIYDMDDATKDVTTMLSNKSRHDEAVPLFVFVAAGGSAESLDGFDLLDIYGARRVVIDERAIDAEVESAVDVFVSPAGSGAPATTATALGANVAAHVNPDVRDDLAHLPAVSFWEEIPTAYSDLAAEAGYDETAVTELREAIALEAFYQSYEDKRELIIDLLFADEADDPVGLAGHVSEQYRTRMAAEIETAEANLERRTVDGETVLVLDTEAYTHRYEFPPEPLLLDELYRRHRDEAAALVGVATDEAYIRSDADLDVRALVETASEHASAAALDARGARDGRVEFLAGERNVAREALLEALAAELSSAATA
ncbi:DNA-binding protein [Halobacteriales archaeon QH_10_65_19]|nr:MAG: DNA-binding protein [Halobacteriales archaeon QH_10_65_19]